MSTSSLSESPTKGPKKKNGDECSHCGGAKKIGYPLRSCPECNGTGVQPGSRPALNPDAPYVGGGQHS